MFAWSHFSHIHEITPKSRPPVRNVNGSSSSVRKNRFFLTLLLLPFTFLTGGLLFGVISWMWLKWDHANMTVPDKHGQLRPVVFHGTLGGYLGRWMLGWLLTLVTGGIYRPWAKVAEWRWVAQQAGLLKLTRVPQMSVPHVAPQACFSTGC